MSVVVFKRMSASSWQRKEEGRQRGVQKTHLDVPSTSLRRGHAPLFLACRHGACNILSGIRHGHRPREAPRQDAKTSPGAALHGSFSQGPAPSNHVPLCSHQPGLLCRHDHGQSESSHYLEAPDDRRGPMHKCNLHTIHKLDGLICTPQALQMNGETEQQLTQLHI